MKKQGCKKHIAINTHLILFALLLLLLLDMFLCCVLEREIGLSIGLIILALADVFVILISPVYFAFSEDAVEIVYCLHQREMIAWKDVKSIYIMGGWGSLGGGLPHYVIEYPQMKKRVFFVVGEIPKTRRTKKLIEKYYKKNIM